jgi:DNA-binding NtrC family response regulator
MAANKDLKANTPGPRHRGALLIVDDDVVTLDSLSVIFKGEYDLFLAENMPTAIKLAQENEIDVVLLDIRLGGGVSGIDVLAQLKLLKPDMEVIILTGFATTDTILKALQLGARDYLDKPYDLATMRAAVNTAMQRR